MEFKDVLRSGCICLHLEGTTKEEIINEMIDMLVAAGKISDRQAILDAVLERENKMSTGMQYGVAIPHGKTATVDDMVVALGLKKEGVDFASLDGEPSRIFIMTISSVNRTGPHVQYLAEIGKLLQSEDIRKRLLDAESEDAIVALLTAPVTEVKT